MIFRVDENGLMYQINIPQEDEDRFLKAQKGGKLEFIKVDYDELPEYSGNLRFSKLFYKKVNGNIEIDFDKTIENWTKDKYKEAENLIYSKYPQSKQNSDLSDKLYYENLLKAKGVKDLESNIIVMVEKFFKGESIDKIVNDITEDKEAYIQLVKVGIRVTWVQMCKNELKKAIEKQKELELPKYPL